MSKRTTIELPEDVHLYLVGYAHERSLVVGKRVSLNAVVTEICKVAVEELRKRDAADQGGAA